jgi:hypothetical protein
MNLCPTLERRANEATSAKGSLPVNYKPGGCRVVAHDGVSPWQTVKNVARRQWMPSVFIEQGREARKSIEE